MRIVIAISGSLVLAGCAGQQPKPATVNPDTPLRITQFYAQPGIERGESTSLCYGVEGAASVRMEPAVEKLWPALSRCFPVKPSMTTTYKLVAEDSAGHTVSQTVRIEVGKPRARIIEVNISATEVHPGQEVVLCYKAENASAAEFGPEARLKHGDPSKDCQTDRPMKTTTYLVRLTGDGGRNDSERVTVRVR